LFNINAGQQAFFVTSTDLAYMQAQPASRVYGYDYPIESGNIYYRLNVSGGSLTIDVLGYDYER